MISRVREDVMKLKIHVGKRWIKRVKKSGVAIALLLIAGFPLSGSAGSKPVDHAAVGYVGADKCRQCHAEKYSGWKSTLHPYKFQKAAPESIIGDFTTHNTILIDGKTTEMFIQDGKYFVKTTGPDHAEHTYKVDYVIGRFWKQLYVTEFPDGALHILPVMWIVQTRTWKTTKAWKKNIIYQNACSGCHNTGTQINFNAADNTYHTTWSDLGVACEACHGPGSRHVNAPEDAKSDTIVNPAKIPDSRRAAMVCGSCHTRGSCCEGKYGYPAGYQPGDLLEFMFSEKPKQFPDDSAAANRQEYIDWKRSGHARAGVMCWDCHYTHRKGHANKYQTKLPGSALCRSCHVVENKGVHGIHSVNNCVGCHMPAIGKRAVKGDVHSHTFRVISPRLTIDAGGYDHQPNSCNACHYHEKDSPEELLKVLETARVSGD